MDFLSTSGYSKLGLPGDMVPGLNDANGLPYANTDLGLAFHSDSAFKRGIDISAPGRGPQLSGAIIPARSDNDTGNNPHNPLYGIAKTGSFGQILTLAGTENTPPRRQMSPTRRRPRDGRARTAEHCRGWWFRSG